MFDLTSTSLRTIVFATAQRCPRYTVGPNNDKISGVRTVWRPRTFALMVSSGDTPFVRRTKSRRCDTPVLCEAPNMSDTWPMEPLCAKRRNPECNGPTNPPIYCTAYQYMGKENKGANGIMGIGTRDERKTVIADDNGNICKTGEVENCPRWQPTDARILENDEKNRSIFSIFKKDFTRPVIYVDGQGSRHPYAGRKDLQVKIQGYRIEPSEIECVAWKFYDDKHAVASPRPSTTKWRNCTIHLVEDLDKGKASALTDYLKTFCRHTWCQRKIHYMEPSHWTQIMKIDRKNSAIHQMKRKTPTI